MSMISELVDRLRAESKSMGKYGVDYMATLLARSADTIEMLSEKARADTSQSCFNCDHYEPKGWCNLFEDTVSPNYKCCSEFAEIKPYEYEIKALHKDYQEPYCEIADTPQTDIHGLTDCDFCKGGNCEDCEGGKDEPQTEDDYFLELMGAVERGEMSDASANQAYYEYINKQAEESDTPQTDCDRYVITNDEGDKAYNCIGCTQTDCGWK